MAQWACAVPAPAPVPYLSLTCQRAPVSVRRMVRNGVVRASENRRATGHQRSAQLVGLRCQGGQASAPRPVMPGS
jgi:hypothetical protein